MNWRGSGGGSGRKVEQAEGERKQEWRMEQQDKAAGTTAAEAAAATTTAGGWGRECQAEGSMNMFTLLTLNNK